MLEKYGHVPAGLEINKEGWSDFIRHGSLENEHDFEDALTISWWSSLNMDIKALLPTLQQFGELQEWTAQIAGLKSFGNTEKNDISVCYDYETNTVQELSSRLDLRTIDKCFVNNILSLTKRFDCLLMDKQGKLYEPTMKNLYDTIQLSNANRFVEDPKQYFEDMSNGIGAPE